MSIKKTEYNGEGFTATMYTLYCDSSEKKMIDIIARDEDHDDAPVTQVKATWVPSELGNGSGVHTLTGLLSYGPIDDESFKTEVLDISGSENEDGEMVLGVYVMPVELQETEE